MRIHNLKSHNMRTFEIPAVGGVGLFPDTLDHRKFFEVDKEIFVFSDINDCKNKCKFLLSKSTEEINTIRGAAHSKCMEKPYSYEKQNN